MTSINLGSQAVDNATNDTFTILSVDANTTINSGSGDDTYNFTANGIPAGVTLTIDDMRTAGSDTVNIDTGGTTGTLSTGQLGRETYQATGQGLIDITSTKPSFGDAFSNVAANALNLDLNSLYTTPTALTTSFSVSGANTMVAVSGVFTRNFGNGRLGAISVSGTSAGESLTIDYSGGNPLPASGLTYDPAAATGGASNSLTLTSKRGRHDVHERDLLGDRCRGRHDHLQRFDAEHCADRLLQPLAGD